MPVERRGQVIAVGIGSTGDGTSLIPNGRRQPSCGGTSRMTRECQVRICEKLEVKFLGLTRQAPAGWATGQIRAGGRAIWQAVANVRTVEAAKVRETDLRECWECRAAGTLAKAYVDIPALELMDV